MRKLEEWELVEENRRERERQRRGAPGETDEFGEAGGLWVGEGGDGAELERGWGGVQGVVVVVERLEGCGSWEGDGAELARGGGGGEWCSCLTQRLEMSCLERVAACALTPPPLAVIRAYPPPN